MYNLSTIDLFKLNLSLHKINKPKDKKLITLAIFNALIIFFTFVILLADIILFASKALAAENIKIYSAAKFLALFIFTVTVNFVMKSCYYKKISSLESNTIEYQNSKGFYILYVLLNNKKMKVTHYLNRIFDFCLWTLYIALSAIIGYIKPNVANEWLILPSPLFASLILFKGFFVDLIASYVVYLNVFKKISNIKINSEIGNFINLLFVTIFVLFYGTIYLLFAYLIANHKMSDWSILSLRYAVLFTIPVFYAFKFIFALIFYRKEKSKVKYLFAFLPLFVFPKIVK
ncbi:hypothetical protein [Metamycoplasma equirhinis]|uniref:hypothetical protein n=1 Tax=Metamycoplasma equirhinis TaxID=92402 RepID=UPI0035938589